MSTEEELPYHHNYVLLPHEEKRIITTSHTIKDQHDRPLNILYDSTPGDNLVKLGYTVAAQSVQIRPVQMGNYAQLKRVLIPLVTKNGELVNLKAIVVEHIGTVYPGLDPMEAHSVFHRLDPEGTFNIADQPGGEIDLVIRWSEPSLRLTESYRIGEELKLFRNQLNDQMIVSGYYDPERDYASLPFTFVTEILPVH